VNSNILAGESLLESLRHGYLRLHASGSNWGNFLLAAFGVCVELKRAEKGKERKWKFGIV
jgi:hypothetical protein